MTAESEKSDNKDAQTTQDYGIVEAVKDNEDYVVMCIGAFGAWQARVWILACAARLMGMWNTLNIVFLTHDTEFICTSFNTTAPDNVTTSTCYDGCTKYEFPQGLFTTSFVEEFELICDRAWMANFTQMILMLGFSFGVSVFGWYSDRFGRRKALIFASFTNVVLMVASPFSPNYWVYSSFRFFIGMASGGLLVVAVVVALEVVGPQHREMAGCCINLPDGIAEALLCAFAYFSPTWRVYLLSLGIVSIFILALMMLLPETPRWLMTNGRLDEARKLMMYAAKCNSLNAATAEENINKSIIGTPPYVKQTNSYYDLFRTTKMTLRTLSLVFIWSVAGLSYYGINQYVTFLGSNVYVTITILGLIQVPLCFIAMWLSKMFGRKIATTGNLVMTGASMFLIIFTPPGHWSAVCLGITGMCGSAMTFNVIYVYTSELYPTPLRNMGYGINSAGSKVGAMVAPFVATMSPHWVPSVIFAVLPCIAACICIFLPETRGEKLQDHLD